MGLGISIDYVFSLSLIVELPNPPCYSSATVLGCLILTFLAGRGGGREMKFRWKVRCRFCLIYLDTKFMPMNKIHEKIFDFHFLHSLVWSHRCYIVRLQQLVFLVPVFFFYLASVFTALGCWVTQSAVDSSMSLEELLSRYNYLSIDRFQIKVYRTALKSTLYSTIWQISTIWRGLNFCLDMFNESLISFVLTI